MSKTIGLDIGNITTVYSSRNKTGIVESRMKVANELNKLSGETVFKNDKDEFLIGAGHFENNFYKFRKNNFINLLHFSVADSISDNSIVNLVIGIPVQQFTIEHKKELAQIIRSNKNIDVKINDKRKRVTIDKILIRPESYGVYKLFEAKKQIVKNVPTIIIDIGGGTTDLSSYLSNGKFNEGTSIPKGLLYYYDLVKQKIFDEQGINLEIEQCKEYTRGNFSLISLDNNLYIDPSKQFFLEIYNSILAKYNDIEKYNVIVCGGGSEAIGHYFKEKIKHVLIDEDITTNAKTFLQIGEQEFNE